MTERPFPRIFSFAWPMFDYFETDLFPVADCNKPNAREPEVTDSNSVFICVIADDRWPTQCRLEYLRPYTAVGEEGQVYYGWARIDSDGFVDHRDRDIHDDHERVIAWQRVHSITPFLRESND